MNTRSHATPSRLTALLGVLAMMATFVVVSATPAFASAEGFARLQAGAQVLPGDFTYTVEVEAAGGVGAPDANLFVVTMPPGIGVSIPQGADLSAPNGFSGKVQQIGPLQRVIYSGGVLAAGSEIDVDIPTTIAAPTQPSETAGTFDVQLSSDAGRSFSTAQAGQSNGGGTLRTVIRFLGIEFVETISPTPAGAQDGSGTEGQTITVAATVRNYLPSDVQVDLTLRPSSGDSDSFPVREASQTKQMVTVPGAGTGAFGTTTEPFQVTLGAAVRSNGNAGDRPVNFDAIAEEITFGGTSVDVDNCIDEDGMKIRPCADLSYEVQVQSRLAVTGSSFAPRAVAPGPRTFTLDAAHSGTPAFTIDGGSINFAATTATLDGESPDTFAAGESKTLAFTGQVEGDDGDFPVDLLYSATDENGFAYTVTFGRLTEPTGNPLSPRRDVLVTIDALAPVLGLDINLPSDAEGQQQTEGKNGDTITVDVTVDDSTAEIAPIVLVANGARIATAEVGPAPLGSDADFRATFEDVDFPLAAGSFTALGAATDPAGNTGEAVAPTELYDNIIPTLLSARTESTSDSPTAVLDALVGDAARISVRFAENNLIIGGCNPNEWTVDGQQTVKEVRFTNGQRCTPRVTGPDNERILILSTAYDREATPSITYTPSSATGSVKDGAGNFALENTVTAVTGIVPAIPDLVDVYRDTSGAQVSPDQCLEEDGPCEQAYFDEGDTDAYWTRFDGNDTVVCVAGARSGYQVEVTDGNGNGLVGTRKSSTGSPSCIRVPINGADGIRDRGVRFINSAGVGPEVLFKISLDTAPPTIDAVTRAGDEVTVQFDDKLVEGEDFALDWLIYEQLTSGDRVFYSPDSVTAPGEGENIDRTQRVLNVDFREYGEFAGIGYDFQSGDFGGARYADRAGNVLDDVNGPVPPNAQ